MRLSSDGKVTTTIASARCDGGAETTAIAPVGDQRRPVSGEPSDAMDPRRLDRLGQGHRRQDGMVVSRRARMDLPAPEGPRRRLWAERLHSLQLCLYCPRSGAHSIVDLL